jgi:hypothetical protein
MFTGSDLAPIAIKQRLEYKQMFQKAYVNVVFFFSLSLFLFYFLNSFRQLANLSGV